MSPPDGTPAGRSADDEPTLAERAAAAALAELRGERKGILGAIGETRLVPLGRTRTCRSAGRSFM